MDSAFHQYRSVMHRMVSAARHMGERWRAVGSASGCLTGLGISICACMLLLVVVFAMSGKVRYVQASCESLFAVANMQSA